MRGWSICLKATLWSFDFFSSSFGVSSFFKEGIKHMPFFNILHLSGDSAKGIIKNYNNFW